MPPLTVTAQKQGDSLFNSNLLHLSPQVPENLSIRALTVNDHNSGFLDCLRNLTTVGEIDATMFENHVRYLQEASSTYIVCLTNPAESGTNGEVLACGTLLLENKFIHRLGKVGHIEDIACREGQQGKGYGKVIILALKALAQQLECYKVILDCSEQNGGFYEKCGFKKKGLEMACYFGS